MKDRVNILITSGGTKIPIDSVRSITNMSTGTFGSRLATMSLEKGHDVTFLKAKGSKSPFSFTTNIADDVSNYDHVRNLVKRINFYNSCRERYKECSYDTWESYSDALCSLLRFNNFDIVILAAAVSDYGVESPVEGKIRSTADEMSIKLKVLPKLISQVKALAPDVFLVGFKLLVNSTDEELYKAAKDSLDKNGCDMVLANDLRDIKKSKHKIMVVDKNPNPGVVYDQYFELEGHPNTLPDLVMTDIIKKVRG